MKTNLYWVKVGLLIGLGFMLAEFLLPIGFIAFFFFIPLLVIVSIAALLARRLGGLRGDFILKQGWSERDHGYSPRR